MLLACSRVIAEIRFRCERSELYKEPILDKATDVVLKHGIRNLGIYHDKRALRIDKKSNQVTSDDLRLLYFYHNRMEGYGFERHV